MALQGHFLGLWKPKGTLQGIKGCFHMAFQGISECFQRHFRRIEGHFEDSRGFHGVMMDLQKHFRVFQKILNMF